MGAEYADAPVGLEDVRDVRAFGEWRAMCALGQNGHLTDAQREDASEEAVVLIFELHGKWEPARCAKFSAYLLSYLDRALIDWWRRELRQSGRGSWNGSTASYRYHGMVSLDEQRILDDPEGPGETYGPPIDRSLVSHDAHA